MLSLIFYIYSRICKKMTICLLCKRDVGKESFSKNQLKKKGSTRVCIRCLASPETVLSVVKPRSFEAEKSDLCSWINSEGGSINKVSVNNDHGYRSLDGTTRMKRGDEVMFVPFSCMMSESQARELSEKNGVTASTHSIMALYLLDEKKKGESSHFYPYIRMLPEKYNDMPLFFGEKYCELLKGSFSLYMLITRNQTIEKQYNRLLTLYPNAMTDVTLEDFKWGRTAIITRVFSCASKEDDEKVREECLVPMADMMNHDARPSSTWGYDRTKKGFLMSANRTILKGSALSDSYGLKCNSRYFINYGFTMPDNHDVNQADIFLPSNERMYSLQVTSDSYDDGFSGYDSMLEGGTETKVSGEGYNRFQISTINETTKGSIVFNSIRALFNCARLTVDSHELLPVKVGGTTRRILLTIEVPVISEENERSALGLIAVCCKDRLLEFPTSLDEDLKNLKVSAPFTPENNISTMLVGEKRVLEWYIELSEFFSDNFHKNLKKSLKGSEKFKYYYEIFWKK
jgi:hypothetical protein